MPTYSKVYRRNLGHVLRRGAQGSAETKDESTNHKDGKIGCLRLHDSGNDGEGVTEEIDTSTPIHIGQNQEWRSANTPDEH